MLLLRTYPNLLLVSRTTTNHVEESLSERRKVELDKFIRDASTGSQWRRVPHIPEHNIRIRTLHGLEVSPAEREARTSRVQCMRPIDGVDQRIGSDPCSQIMHDRHIIIKSQLQILLAQTDEPMLTLLMVRVVLPLTGSLTEQT